MSKDLAEAQRQVLNTLILQTDIQRPWASRRLLLSACIRNSGLTTQKFDAAIAALDDSGYVVIADDELRVADGVDRTPHEPAVSTGD